MAGPEQTMTNAAVDGIATSADGRVLKLPLTDIGHGKAMQSCQHQHSGSPAAASE